MSGKLSELLLQQNIAIEALSEKTKDDPSLQEIIAEFANRQRDITQIILDSKNLAEENLVLCNDDSFLNFYIDENGDHYGTIGQLKAKIGQIYREVPAGAITSFKLQSIKRILKEGGKILYNYEQSLELFNEFILIPEVESEFTEWRNFYLKDEEHYGGKDAIINKLAKLHKKSKDQMRELLNPFFKDIKSIEIRSKGGLKILGYCYEELIKEIKQSGVLIKRQTRI